MNESRIRGFLPVFAWIVALTAMGGSLYYSEVRGFIPCTLCWYQRILMYPLVAVILVGILRRDAGLPLYVLPLSVLGMSVSTYHYLLQIGVLTEAGTCKAGVPCTVKYVNYFGFVTIPFMALTAFYMITMAMVAYWFGGGDKEIGD